MRAKMYRSSVYSIILQHEIDITTNDDMNCEICYFFIEAEQMFLKTLHIAAVLFGLEDYQLILKPLTLSQNRNPHLKDFADCVLHRDSELPVEDFLFSAGGGFLLGAVAGYAIKKVMKIAAVWRRFSVFLNE